MVTPRLPAGFLSTTANAIEGYVTTETFGVVRGITVRSRSIVGMFGAVLQRFVGGDISLLTELCEETRARAFADAIAHAQALGANALIAVRYDATEIMQGVSEVLCYGTAVRVVPQRQH